MKQSKKILKLLQLAVTIVLLSYLLSRWGYSLNTLQADVKFPFWLLPCFLISIVVTPLLAGWRWQTFLSAIRIKIRLAELIRINFLSIFWGVMLPSSDGFAFIRMALVAHRHPENKEKAIGSIILEKFFGIFILLTTAFCAGFFFKNPQTGRLRLITGLCLFFMLALIAAVAIMPVFQKPVIGKSIFKKVLRFMQILLLSWQQAHKGKLFLGFLLIFSVQLMSYLTIYCLFRFMGYEIPIIYHLSLIPIIQIISLLPVTISGFGLREGAFVFFYQQLGIPANSLITLSMLNFFIQTGIPALIGGLLSLIVNIPIPKAEK